MEESIEKLEQCLGYKFKNTQLITQALTHKSCTKIKNNERLEFLGDAVLDLVIAEYLYMKFPTKPEGELSKLRASLVSEKGLKNLALKLDLGEYILVSKAEDNNHGRNKSSLLSNAFEALIGAVYLEGGMKSTKMVMIPLLESVYPKIDLKTLFKDYKSSLQEITQVHFGVTPKYVLLHSSGPDHKKEFEMAALLNNKELSRGRGATKKDAEQSAAKEAIEILKKDIG
ncbi:MAG: ribonuclease III [Campylobacteraceae bacterium]|jgi:ribonuclease-3|nr:ribonuclease III [Campylobacteraceae bacterium]